MQKYTIRDIAVLSGVSPATVSRTLNSSTNVSEENRRKVMAVVDSLGYRPRVLARGLVSGKTNLVALLLGDVRNPYYADIAYHVQKELFEQGYPSVLFNTEYNVTLEQDSLNFAAQFGFAGIIMITAMDGGAFLESLRQLTCPVVLLNRSVEGFEGSMVIQDNFQAGYVATKHLIELGHHRIAFLCGPTRSRSSALRVTGYRQALQNYALPCDPTFIFQGDLTIERGREVAGQYLRQWPNTPSAIICGNDLMAIGFIDVCRKNNIRVPEQLSVMGVDDIEFAALEGIKLSTVRQNVSIMGKKASELLLAKIETPDCPSECVILEPRLVLRNTTAPYRPAPLHP